MEELQALDAGSWFDDAFRRGAHTGILPVARSSESLRGMLLNLELKNSVVPLPRPGAGRAWRKSSDSACWAGSYFSSFNHASMALIKEKEPKAQTALLYSNILHRTKDYVRLCRRGRHPSRYTPPWTERSWRNAMKRGLKVRPWTVDDPKAAERLAELGVDALISNCPEELFK